MNEKEKEEKQKFYVVGYGKPEKVSEEVFKKEMSKRRKEMNEPIKPKDCFECIYFGKNGEHLKSGKAHFPSLCEKDLLFFQCGGKEGIKKGE